jgi:hypothetical protein
MDSRRYAAYRCAVELLEGPEAERLSSEQRELVRDHAEELLLHRGRGLDDEVEETSQSADCLLQHLAAIGLLSRGLAAEVGRAVFACAPSTATEPEKRSALATLARPDDGGPL